MDTRDFLARVLGDSGYYCIFGLKTGGNRRVQKFYPSIGDALEAAAAMDRNGLNAYFALGTFKTGENRTRSNVELMRSFFLDLDCGPGKPFADQREAIGALRDFCKTMQMPKPILVNSGGGIHVYWPLVEPVSFAEWLPVAEALKEACIANGFGADSNVTSDAARILRVPGTHNYKFDPPAEVELLAGGEVKSVELAEMQEFVQGYAQSITSSLGSNSLMGTSTSTMDRLMGNKEFVFKDIVKKTMAGRGCEQIKHIIVNQESVDEPMWRAGLSIAKFCTDGDKAAHKISCEYSGYSPRETEKKLASIVAPYTCETFNQYRPGVCEGCPFWKKIKTPLSIGSQVAEATEEDNTVEAANADTGEAETYVIPSFPKPYFRGRTGGVYIQVRDDDGDPYDECVYPNDLYFVRRVYDKNEGESLIARLHLPHDGVREFTITLGQATSPEELRKVLSARGVVTSHKKAWEKIMTYSNSWVSHLQSETVADTAHRQFGWTDDEKLESFVLGGKEIFGDRTTYNPPTTPTAALMPAFDKNGTLQGWVDQVNFFNREGMEPFQFMVCLALASPLMALTPYNAAMYSLYSDGSGHGKTTAQKIALAAFGNPSLLIMQSKDTVNHKMNRMEVLKNLPAQWDEVTNMRSEEASDVIYMVQNGMQKGRMSSGSNVERVTGRPWKTTCGFTSNESMLSKVQNNRAKPEGETYRFLEYHAQKFNFASKAETDALSQEVGRHYGHAGLPLIQYIINNKDEVRKIIQTMQRQIDETAKLEQKDRFWSTTVAVTVTACVLGNKLGLLKYDPKRLRDWAIELVQSNKRMVQESTLSIQAHVTNYVSDNYGNILWIKSTDDRRTNTSSGDGIDSLIVPDQQPRVKFVARYETDTHMLYLLPKPFQRWCAEQRLNYQSALNEIITEMGGSRRKMRVGKGTKFDMPPVNVIQIDCNDLELKHGSSDA